MKKHLPIAILSVTFLFAALCATAADRLPYRPLVVEGNTWRYNELYLYWVHDKPDLDWSLKIEGDTIIDGKQYKKVYAYTNRADTPDLGIAYAFIREDCEARKVYGLGNEEFLLREKLRQNWFPSGEYLLYDFDKPENSEWWEGYSRDKKVKESITSVNGNDLRVFELENTNCRIIEGVGGIIDWASDLFCIDAAVASSQGYCPFLYEVTDAEGNIIYEIEENRPKGGVDNVSVDDADGAPEYFNLQGVKVNNPRSGEIYIKHEGNSTTKIVK